MLNIENKLRDATSVLCPVIVDLVNINYAIQDYTYRKMCLTNMVEKHLLQILEHKISYLKNCIEDVTSIPNALFEIIIYCVAWYLMKYSENSWSFYKQKSTTEDYI